MRWPSSDEKVMVTTMTMGNDVDTAKGPASEKRARLLAARAERERVAAVAREAHDLLVLELEDRFSTELGPRGAAWDLCNEDNTCGEGPICMKLGDPVSHKQWKAAGVSPEDKTTYVAPWIIYPEKAIALDILHRRPELLDRATATMNRLFGLSQAALQGKY